MEDERWVAEALGWKVTVCVLHVEWEVYVLDTGSG